MSTTDLRAVQDKVNEAVRSAEGDGGASPVLVAVVREFASKATKALKLADGAREWEAIVELEQAGDSAKAAAAADAGSAADTIAAVEAAHMAICVLKAETAKAAV